MFLDVAIIVIKAVVIFHLFLIMAQACIWVERKGSALIQDRIGANRAAIFGWDLAGVFNTFIADPVKALMKEDFVPKGTSQFLHSLGPFLALFPVLISFAVIPVGPPLEVAGRTVTLQLAELDAGLLYVFAMGSLAVYGVVIAGGVSNNKFSLLGGLRASAQMISYEVIMGLSVLGILAVYETLDLNAIVRAQQGTILGFLPKWGVLLNPVGFLLFFFAMMAETKRAPFDLPESESELVAGYLTEYSGMKFLLFWLGEFAEIAVASALITVLFFGGWQLPWFDITSIPPTPEWNFQWGPLLGVMIFGAKVAFFCVLQVIIRWTLPRFRYDQLMSLCWKWMLPISMANLLITTAVVLFYRVG